MDLPKAVQGVSGTARWPEFTGLDFCNEEWNKYFQFLGGYFNILTSSVNRIIVDFIFNSESYIYDHKLYDPCYHP